jgi:hypothetical protein
MIKKQDAVIVLMDIIKLQDKDAMEFVLLFVQPLKIGLVGDVLANLVITWSTTSAFNALKVNSTMFIN